MDATPGAMAVSPDGTKIAFVSGRSIVVMGVDGSDARDIAAGRTAFVSPPTWAPNGTAIIFRDDRELWLAPLQGERRVVRTTDRFPISAIGQVRWVP